MMALDLLGGLSRMALPERRTMDLPGRVALVTGGGDGIGRQTALLLARKGCQVAVLDRNEAAAKQVATELGEHRSRAVATDVTDREAMRDAVASVVEHFGRLDVVVANAGITPPPGTIRTLRPAEFDQVLAVNLTGVLNTVQPAIDHLVQTEGHIVVVASCAAFCPPLGGASYMISKAAAEQLGRALSLELAPHRVSVTTSYFGIVETQLTRSTLDDDELGRAANDHLPALLRRRISAASAAEVIVDGIEHRRPTTIAPLPWLPLAWLRGLANPVLDRYLRADRWTHEMIHRLEIKQGPSATPAARRLT